MGLESINNLVDSWTVAWTLLLSGADWKVRVGLIFLPTIFYGVFMLGKRFPVQERVAAGVSYRDMLREFGFVGAFLCSFLVVTEVTRVFSAQLGIANPYMAGLIGGVILAGIFGAATGFASRETISA